MLETKLTGELIADFDSEIMLWMKNKRFREEGNKMIIGIDNRKAKLYRVIEVTGFNDFSRVAGFLFDMGMTDILDSGFVRTKGCDCRFRFHTKLIPISHNIDAKLF